jgi:hypothetical protein
MLINICLKIIFYFFKNLMLKMSNCQCKEMRSIYFKENNKYIDNEIKCLYCIKGIRQPTNLEINLQNTILMENLKSQNDILKINHIKSNNFDFKIQNNVLTSESRAKSDNHIKIDFDRKMLIKNDQENEIKSNDQLLNFQNMRHLSENFIEYSIINPCSDESYFINDNDGRQLFGQEEKSEYIYRENNLYCNNPHRKSENFELNISMIEKTQDQCKYKLQCNHRCNGVDSEVSHPGCFKWECMKEWKEAKCSICQDFLCKYPIVKFSCSDIFHYHCIQDHISKKSYKWVIDFSNFLCPNCRNFFHLDYIPNLKTIMEEKKKIYDEINIKKKLKLIEEGWSEHKIDSVIFKYCQKCKKDFFYGFRDCFQSLNEDLDKESLCNECKKPDIRNDENKFYCKIHGDSDNLKFKCKFCCSLATTHCWKNDSRSTRFCDNCHKRQLKKDFLTNKKREELPKCLGGKNCPFGVPHPENGEEYAVCFLCH